MQVKKIYYSISEVSELADVEQHTLRHWESNFSILKPRRNRGGKRSYKERDIKIVLLLHRLLNQEGHTTEHTKQRLKDDKEFVKQFLDIPLEQALSQPMLDLKQKKEPIETEERAAEASASDELILEIRKDLQEVLAMVEDL